MSAGLWIFLIIGVLKEHHLSQLQRYGEIDFHFSKATDFQGAKWKKSF